MIELDFVEHNDVDQRIPVEQLFVDSFVVPYLMFHPALHYSMCTHDVVELVLIHEFLINRDHPVYK